MDSLKLHKNVTEDYKNYIQSFINIRDHRIKDYVDEQFKAEGLLPDPLVQFNPAFERSVEIKALMDKGLHPKTPDILGDYRLYKHQVEAISQGIQENGFIVTSGTGSGKSLTFLATIFNHILKCESEIDSIVAVLVYPMNALINSQEEEIMKYEINYLRASMSPTDSIRLDPDSDQNKNIPVPDLLSQAREVATDHFPIRYNSYTGQSSQNQREVVRRNKPHIILTNYMMLELILTREQEVWMREAMSKDLKFLVFDELHTYRGRQGSDVAMLIRRLRHLAAQELIAIGTSATMATEGSLEDQKQAVAQIGELIFGQTYNTSQIIGEYLEFYTEGAKTPAPSDVKNSLNIPIKEENFATHPFCVWLEREIAVFEKEPGIFQRKTPYTLKAIAEKLAVFCSISMEHAQSAITTLLEALERLNVEAARKKTYKSYLPFKIHQFISQTSTVYVSLEPPEHRQISITTSRYIQDEQKQDIFAYPVLFSRHSGHDFVCVRKDYEEMKLTPRDTDDIAVHITKSDLKGSRKTGKKKQVLEAEQLTDGYIIFDYDDKEPIWSDELITGLPDSWWKEKKGGAVLDNYYEYRVPQKIYFSKDGSFSDQPDKTKAFEAWYMPARLLFDPTAGIIYDLKTKENTKLMQLGNEGRSTATTITAFSVIRELIRQEEPHQIQKLLSFTDNRQDASLQAGHFNDFMVTIQLRSALYHALQKADGHAIKVYDIARLVFQELGISENEYAKEPNPTFPEQETTRAIQSYLLYNILRDLKKGWRYNLPNLEQAGLLKIEFERLPEFCAQDNLFNGVPILENAAPEERIEILSDLLHYFRTSNAIHHKDLDENRDQVDSLIHTKLDNNKFWAPDRNEHLEVPPYMRIVNPGKTRRGIYTESIGPMSYFGKYIKKLFISKGLEAPKTDAYNEYADQICQLLRTANQLTETEIKGDKATVKGYRLRSDNLLWELGDGKSVWLDRLRNTAYKDLKAKPNTFFQKLYKLNFKSFQKTIKAAEHTGQLSAEERVEREGEFRRGNISSLFCSPTMELGIDIRELNIVHMRNVPPNPANYAQRSGRAGRSGQTAVVFTYCSKRSPHDSNYFEQPAEMVSGKVVPPRIDLKNEELINSHLHAFILMKLRIKELNVSISNLIDLSTKDTLPLKTDLQATIAKALEHAPEWADEFSKTIEAIIPELRQTPWFSDARIRQMAANFLKAFDAAFERWRVLFRNVQVTLARAHAIQSDPMIKSSSPEKRQADYMYRSALRQQELLLNDTNNRYGNESEFYVFRYLASEGFLPGYNFTRLPVRTFAGVRSQRQGSFISRSRFVALKEYGPGNLIYHNGNKYRINRMILPDSLLKTTAAVVSKETGYIFLDNKTGEANNDPITNSPLDSGSTMLAMNNLLELSETDAVPQERISCEEEERLSTGYEVEQYFSYPRGIQSTQQANIKIADVPLLHAIFCPATQLVQVNHRWRRSQDDNGFMIHAENGQWLKKADRDNPDIAEHIREVKLFARDTADSLYLQPVKDLSLEPDQVISLAYALKLGIEAVFRVEENEVNIWIMGTKEEPNIMIYEASEGSLGILSQMIASDTKMKQVYTEACKAMHFDPVTFDDTAPDIPKASYDDLLSYYNQPHHDSLDRFSIKEALKELLQSTLEPFSQNRDRMEQFNYLLNQLDKHSATEEPLIRYLYKHDYVLPDKAQIDFEDYYINADFAFKTKLGYTYLFCDGSVHSKPEVREIDQQKRSLLIESGEDIIEWYFNERSGESIENSIEKLIHSRKDIFRKL